MISAVGGTSVGFSAEYYGAPLLKLIDLARQPKGFKPRVPTLRQLAALVREGLLQLPRFYRPGYYLDIFV